MSKKSKNIIRDLMYGGICHRSKGMRVQKRLVDLAVRKLLLIYYKFKFKSWNQLQNTNGNIY